jgi:aldose 1-epimerase
MTAKANGPTPIMLSSHAYWLDCFYQPLNYSALIFFFFHNFVRNLDAYVSCGSASKHYLQLNAPQYIATDSILVPTGELQPVKNTPLDFTQPTEIGSRLNQTVGLCGQGCTGYVSANFWSQIFDCYHIPAWRVM